MGFNRETRKRKNVAKSFYLDNGIMLKLAEQSEQEGVSVNSLVGRILKEHVELRRPARKYPSVMLANELVKRLLDAKEDIFSAYGMAKGQKIFGEAIMRARCPRNLMTYKMIIKGFCDYGQWAGYEEHVVDGKLVISLSHELGERWSRVMGAFFYSGLKEIIGEDYPPKDVFTPVDSGLLIVLPATIIEEP